MLWQGLFAYSFHVVWHGYQAFLLGAAVWLVYAADRCLDGYRLDVDAVHSDRHAFYRRHLGAFVVAMSVVAVATLVTLVRNATVAEWYAGGAVAGVTFLYMVGIHKVGIHRVGVHGVGVHGYGRRFQRHVPKEIQVGVVFAVGVTLEAWLRAPSLALLVASLGFGLLCTLNCGLIAVWEHDTDRAQRQPSIARSHPAVSGYLGRATLGLAVLAAGLALILPETTFWAMLALSALGLAGLGYTEERLTTTALRVLGDAVLLTPLVPLVGWLLAGWLGG